MNSQFEESLRQNQSQLVCMHTQTSYSHQRMQQLSNRFNQSSTADPTKKNRQKHFLNKEMHLQSQFSDKQDASENNVHILQIDRQFQRSCNNLSSQHNKCSNCCIVNKLCGPSLCKGHEDNFLSQQKNLHKQNDLQVLRENDRNIKSNIQSTNFKIKKIDVLNSKPGTAKKDLRQQKIKSQRDKQEIQRHKSKCVSINRKNYNSSRGAYFIRNFPQTYFENVDMLFQLINRRKYKPVYSKNKPHFSKIKPQQMKLLQHYKGDIKVSNQVIVNQKSQKIKEFESQQEFDCQKFSQDSESTVRNPRTVAQFSVNNHIQARQINPRTAHNSIKYSSSSRELQKIQLQLPQIINNVQDRNVKYNTISAQSKCKKKENNNQIVLPEQPQKQQKIASRKQVFQVNQLHKTQKVFQSKSISARPISRSPTGLQYVKQKSQIRYNSKQNQQLHHKRNFTQKQKSNNNNSASLIIDKAKAIEKVFNQKTSFIDRQSDQNLNKLENSDKKCSSVNQKKNINKNCIKKITLRSNQKRIEKEKLKQSFNEQKNSKKQALNKHQNDNKIQIKKGNEFRKNQGTVNKIKKQAQDKRNNIPDQKEAKPKGIQKRNNHRSCEFDSEQNQPQFIPHEDRFTFQQKNSSYSDQDILHSVKDEQRQSFIRHNQWFQQLNYQVTEREQEQSKMKQKLQLTQENQISNEKKNYGSVIVPEKQKKYSDSFQCYQNQEKGLKICEKLPLSHPLTVLNNLSTYQQLNEQNNRQTQVNRQQIQKLVDDKMEKKTSKINSNGKEDNDSQNQEFYYNQNSPKNLDIRQEQRIFERDGFHYNQDNENLINEVKNNQAKRVKQLIVCKALNRQIIIKEDQEQKKVNLDNSQKQQETNLRSQVKKVMELKNQVSISICPKMRIDSQVSLSVCPCLINKKQKQRQESYYIDCVTYKKCLYSYNQFSVIIQPLKQNQIKCNSELKVNNQIKSEEQLTATKINQQNQNKCFNPHNQRKQQNSKQLRISLDSNISSFNNLSTDKVINKPIQQFNLVINLENKLSQNYQQNQGQNINKQGFDKIAFKKQTDDQLKYNMNENNMQIKQDIDLDNNVQIVEKTEKIEQNTILQINDQVEQVKENNQQYQDQYPQSKDKKQQNVGQKMNILKNNVIVSNQFCKQTQASKNHNHIRRNKHRNSICELMMSPLAQNNSSSSLWPNKNYHPSSFNPNSHLATNNHIETHWNLGKVSTTNELNSPNLTSNDLKTTNRDNQKSHIECSDSEQKIMTQFYDQLIQLGVDQIRDIPDNQLLLLENAQRMGYQLSSQQQYVANCTLQNRKFPDYQLNGQLYSKSRLQDASKPVVSIPKCQRTKIPSFTLNLGEIDQTQTPITYTNLCANKPYPYAKNIFHTFQTNQIDETDQIGQQSSVIRTPSNPFKTLQKADKIEILHIGESQLILRGQNTQQLTNEKQKKEMDQSTKKRPSIEQGSRSEYYKSPVIQNSVIHVYGINGSRTPQEFVKNSRLIKDRFLNIINEDEQLGNILKDDQIFNKVVSTVLIEDSANSKNSKGDLQHTDNIKDAIDLKSVSKQSIGIQCVQMIENYDEEICQHQQNYVKVDQMGQLIEQRNQTKHGKETLIGFYSNIINYNEIIQKPESLNCQQCSQMKQQSLNFPVFDCAKQGQNQQNFKGKNHISQNLKTGTNQEFQREQEQLSDSALTFGHSSQEQDQQSKMLRKNKEFQNYQTELKLQRQNSSVGLSQVNLNENETPNYQFNKRAVTQSKNITMKLINQRKQSIIRNQKHSEDSQTQYRKDNIDGISCKKLRIKLRQGNNQLQKELQLPLYSKNTKVLQLQQSYEQSGYRSQIQSVIKGNNGETVQQLLSQTTNNRSSKPYKYPPKNKNPYPQYTDRGLVKEGQQAQINEQIMKNGGITQRVRKSKNPNQSNASQTQSYKNCSLINDKKHNSKVQVSERNAGTKCQNQSKTSGKTCQNYDFDKQCGESVLNQQLIHRFENAQIVNHIQKQKMRLQVITLSSQFTPERWKKLVRCFDRNYQTACEILNLFKGNFQGRIFPFQDHHQGVCWLFGLHYQHFKNSTKEQNAIKNQRARFEPFVLAKDHDFHRCKSYKQAIYQVYLSTLTQKNSFIKKKERGSLILNKPRDVNEYLQMITGSPIVRLNNDQKRNWKKLKLLQKHRNIRALVIDGKGDEKRTIFRILASQQINIHEKGNSVSTKQNNCQINVAGEQKGQVIKLVKMQDQRGNQFNVEWGQFCERYQEVLLGCFNSHYHIRTLCVPKPQSQEKQAFIFTLVINNQKQDSCKTDRANSQKSRRAKSDRGRVKQEQSTHCVFSLITSGDETIEEGRLLIYSAIDSNKYQYLGKGDTSFNSMMLKPGEYLLIVQCMRSIEKSMKNNILVYSSNQNVEISPSGKWFSCSEEGMANEFEQFRNYLK